MNQDVVTFFKNFLQAEYEALVAQATERDTAVFQTKVAAAEAFCAPTVPLRIHQPEPADLNEDYFSQMAEQIQDDAPRKLFLIRQYEHPEHGTLYRGYVSSNLRKSKNYFFSYYAQETNEGWKLVSRYTISRDHSKWEWSAGLDKLASASGKLVATERLLEPDDERDLADYLSD